MFSVTLRIRSLQYEIDEKDNCDCVYVDVSVVMLWCCVQGEAQIAVIDLLGMVIGIAVSRLIGADRAKIAAIFAALTAVDLLCVFNEIQR